MSIYGRRKGLMDFEEHPHVPDQRGLPHGVLPIALIAHFPRIVNLIAMQWNDTASCPAYFEELFADRRGSRQGFPQDVQRDLSRLRSYWYTRTTTLRD